MDELKMMIDSMMLVVNGAFQGLEYTREECERLYPILQKVYEDYYMMKKMLETTLDNYMLVEKDTRNE